MNGEITYRYQNMTRSRWQTDSLTLAASSGHLKNYSFWHFKIDFQPLRFPLVASSSATPLHSVTVADNS